MRIPPALPALRRRHLLGLASLAALPGAAHADALQDILDDPRYPLAGLSVLVQRDGRTLFEGQAGRRLIAAEDGGQDQPVTADTLFRMASVSKLIVALGVMRLVEAGRLNLDADIDQALGYPLRHPAHPQRAITLRLLLSHRSSLLDKGDSYADSRSTLEDSVRRGLSWSDAAPGRHFQYSNFNYVVLACVMERASGRRFDQLMQEQVLAPLGMQGSFNREALPPAQRAQLATLYRRQADGAWRPQADAPDAAAPAVDLTDYVLGSRGALFSPQGGLRTRVRDLGTVMAMLTNEGLHQNQPFLKPASVAALMSEHWRHDPNAGNGDNLGGLFQAWGLGLQHFIDRSRLGWGDRLRPQGGLSAWGHLGEAYGLLSGMIFEPHQRIGVIYAIGGSPAGGSAHHGRYSSFTRAEERLLALLWAKTAS